MGQFRQEGSVNSGKWGCGPAARKRFSLPRCLWPAGDVAGGGTGVIWNRIAVESLVIPAQAGIQSVGGASPIACRVDSRFRGNDCDSEHQVLANDTSTREGVRATILSLERYNEDLPGDVWLSLGGP